MKKWLLIASVLVCTGNFYGLQLSWCATPTIDMPLIPSDNNLTTEELEYYLFHHDYMTSAAIATLNALRKDDTDEAIRIQQQIIDEIIFESFPSIPDLTVKQRQILVRSLKNIKKYYLANPRGQSKWYKELPKEEKAVYLKVDDRLKKGIQKSLEKPKKIELKNNNVIEPVLTYKGYMTDISIHILNSIHKGKKLDAVRQLETTLDDLIAYVGPVADSTTDHSGDLALRNRSVGCLLKIKKYRTGHKRIDNVWRSLLSKSKKEELSILDDMLIRITSKLKVTAGQIFFGIESK